MPRVATTRPRSMSRFLARVLDSAKPSPFPGFIKPCLATQRDEVTSARGFVHELKLDGYRIQAHLRDGHVTLYTRTGLDWSNRFPAIATELACLPSGKVILDGELISADASGCPDFPALQDDLKRGRHDRMVYYAFDLLHLDGFDTRAAPLIERKRVLQSFLAEAGSSAPGEISRVIYSEHFEDGADLYRRALGMGLEGIVSKRADAPYRSGRTEAWCKVKAWKTARFAVAGFVPEGADGLLKLRLARREGGMLIYVGAVGTGWDRKTARSIRRTLKPHVRAASPLSKPVKMQDTWWVEPLHDAEVAYSDVTTGGLLQRPVFKALVP
jgi:bifunctional non-homologous end joining protein LigD